MAEDKKHEKSQGQLVFGLDIGTRSIVGTVGYREGDNFIVVAQAIKEHETRAMLDGQIHDIGQVGKTINHVKKQLESKLDIKLTDVCIAAAGRVLRTIETNATIDFEKDTVVTGEHIASLMSLAIEKAYSAFLETNDTDMKFYCVGNSVIRYYMNGYQIGNLESHKAKTIGADIIATFLPDDVVDGLYKAVEIAGLKVVNMTLEPIAAIEVAIPEMYRMLNIALVDVGAGTSDICITKDGCIIAYGMIPIAGDSLTEIVARECLVDFGTAEKIKRGIKEADTVDYSDIMGLPQTITKDRVLELLNQQLDDMTLAVSDKIKELNGGKPVSAVFVVGGGGKVDGYTDKLAEFLGIVKERVAVRGEEVMTKIKFNEETKKDSLLVTPIGICLNYYEQSNSFIYVTFNDDRIKLYDTGNLAIVDAAMHADFPNDGLFPRRGAEINYTVNGVKKIQRGSLGEPAKILLNGQETDLYSSIRANDVITVEESTKGDPAKLVLAKVPELKNAINVTVNGSKILLPKFATVNGEIKTQYYDVQDGDNIEILDYYTVSQVKEFMDVTLEDNMTVVVNNEEASDDTKVYDNFAIKWALKSEVIKKLSPKKTKDDSSDIDNEDADEVVNDNSEDNSEDYSFSDLEAKYDSEEELENENLQELSETEASEESIAPEDTAVDNPTEEVEVELRDDVPYAIGLIVNARPVTLTGKANYVFVDVFEHIDFDTKTVKGTNLVTTVNDKSVGYMEPIHDGDVIEIYWEK